jgi:hypothetical protein
MHRVRYLIGSLTLLAAIAGAIWVVRILNSLDDRPGLSLQIEFRDARGLRAGADVRYRGVSVGTVRSVTIAADGGKSVANVLLDPPGAAQACLNSSFWIVTPRFGGITGGATGLDTLVRDAYIAFQTPLERGSPLTGGSLLTGREKPSTQIEPDALEEIEHGDLLMTLMVPENHGLRPGSPVIFRGQQTGDVRSVELAKEGTHVEVQLRIARRFRQTVTDKCAFWVARPALSGALFSGFTVTDMNALLSPYVAYYGEPGKGVMVQDGHRAAAEAARPNLEVSAVPSEALRRAAPKVVVATNDLVLVRIVYAAVEKDTFSADDPVHHEGTGVLYQDQAGRTVVVTARSAVDGSYTETDLFGTRPDIAEEQLKVMLADGTVLRAARVWVEPNGADLATLVLDEVPPDLRGTPLARLQFGGVKEPGSTPTTLCRAGADGAPLPPIELGGNDIPKLDESQGAAVTLGEKVVGIYGRAEAHGAVPIVVSLDLLPQDLRPQ